MTPEERADILNDIEWMLEEKGYGYVVCGYEDKSEMAVIDNILFRFWQMGWLNLATDTISRQDAIALLEEAESARLRGDILLFYPVMLNGLKKLPSAQPEIIRCKDCKHRGETPIDDGRYWCDIHDTFMYYCSDAERRTDG